MSNYSQTFSIKPWFPLQQFSYRPVFDLAHLPDFRSAACSSLSSFIVFQIDYYVSDDNLAKDEYLRSQMDNQGWVNILTITDFPRIKSMTNDIELILRSMKSSATVEIQNNKLRKRQGWERWINPMRLQLP